MLSAAALKLALFALNDFLLLRSIKPINGAKRQHYMETYQLTNFAQSAKFGATNFWREAPKILVFTKPADKSKVYQGQRFKTCVIRPLFSD